MKRSEAHELVLMIAAACRGRPSPDTLAYFEASLLKLDAQAATDAVLAGRREWKVFPSWAEFAEAYRVQRKLAEPDTPTLPPKPTDGSLPLWLKRWICARILHDRFDREEDLRIFPEELAIRDPDDPSGDLGLDPVALNLELMPEDEWIAEAEQITEGEAWSAIRGLSKVVVS